MAFPRISMQGKSELQLVYHQPSRLPVQPLTHNNKRPKHVAHDVGNGRGKENDVTVAYLVKLWRPHLIMPILNRPNKLISRNVSSMRSTSEWSRVCMM